MYSGDNLVESSEAGSSSGRKEPNAWQKALDARIGRGKASAKVYAVPPTSRRTTSNRGARIIELSQGDGPRVGDSAKSQAHRRGMDPVAAVAVDLDAAGSSPDGVTTMPGSKGAPPDDGSKLKEPRGSLVSLEKDQAGWRGHILVRFLLSFNGIMPHTQLDAPARATIGEKAFDFVVNGALRGMGQVGFANNPLSGLCCLIGACWGTSWTFVGLTVLGSFVGLATALIMSLSRGQFTNGIYGYNCVLVGEAAAVFFDTSTSERAWAVAGLVVLGAAFSTVLVESLGTALVKNFGSPPFTMPFVSATLAILMCAAGTPSDSLVLLTGPARLNLAGAAGNETAEAAAAAAASWNDFGAVDAIEAVVMGVGQVWFSSTWQGSLLCVLGMAVCSRVIAGAQLVGSAVGALTGYFVGAPAGDVVFGLWGFSPALTATVTGGMFFVLTRRAVGVTLLGAALTAILNGGVSMMLRVIAMPAMTLPFNIAAVLFMILNQGVPVRLATLTYPEEHLRSMWQQQARRRELARNAMLRLSKLWKRYKALVEEWEEREGRYLETVEPMPEKAPRTGCFRGHSRKADQWSTPASGRERRVLTLPLYIVREVLRQARLQQDELADDSKSVAAAPQGSGAARERRVSTAQEAEKVSITFVDMVTTRGELYGVDMGELRKVVMPTSMADVVRRLARRRRAQAAHRLQTGLADFAGVGDGRSHAAHV